MLGVIEPLADALAHKLAGVDHRGRVGRRGGIHRRAVAGVVQDRLHAPRGVGRDREEVPRIVKTFWVVLGWRR